MQSLISQHERFQAALLFLGLATMLIAAFGLYGEVVVGSSVPTALAIHFMWPSLLLNPAQVTKQEE
jgi:hypothetical protein